MLHSCFLEIYTIQCWNKIAVAGLAGTIGCNGTALFVIIQSLMVTELVHDLSLDVQQPFSTILAELLERILEKEVVAI